MSHKPPLTFKPVIHRCDVFQEDEGYGSTTIVVVPTKVVYHDNGYTVAWRCSMGDNCQNRFCHYSRASGKNREEMTRFG
jgi:hypothetical protein